MTDAERIRALERIAEALAEALDRCNWSSCAYAGDTPAALITRAERALRAWEEYVTAPGEDRAS